MSKRHDEATAYQIDRWRIETIKRRDAHALEHLTRCRGALVAAGIPDDFMEFGTATTDDHHAEKPCLLVYLTVELDGEGGGIFWVEVVSGDEGLVAWPRKKNSLSEGCPVTVEVPGVESGEWWCDMWNRAVAFLTDALANVKEPESPDDCGPHDFPAGPTGLHTGDARTIAERIRHNPHAMIGTMVATDEYRLGYLSMLDLMIKTDNPFEPITLHPGIKGDFLDGVEHARFDVREARVKTPTDADGAAHLGDDWMLRWVAQERALYTKIPYETALAKVKEENPDVDWNTMSMPAFDILVMANMHPVI